MLNPSRLFSFCIAASSCLTLIVACSLRPSPLTEQEQLAKRDALIAAGGYNIAGTYAMDSASERWWRDGVAVDTVLLAPREPGVYPLILYLPGLGEPANAGRLWREYWAKAGYAVLSIQPAALADAFADLQPEFPQNPDPAEPFDRQHGEEFATPGEPADGKPDKGKPSQALIDGERRYISRNFFTAESLQTRIGHFLWAYDQCRQRVQAKQGLFAQADLSKVLIAGYDIGADTAVELITANRSFSPMAAMLISPVAAAASGNPRERFRSVGLPVLVLSSEQDNDIYAITTPRLRKSIWDYVASPDKYLLLVKSADHALLSGSGWSAPRRGMEPPPGGSMPEFAGQFQREGRRLGGPPAGGMGRPPRSGEADRPQVYQQIAAILGVSTAFFDAVAKSDTFAELWLKQNARAWLKSVADLNAN